MTEPTVTTEHFEAALRRLTDFNRVQLRRDPDLDEQEDLERYIQAWANLGAGMGIDRGAFGALGTRVAKIMDERGRPSNVMPWMEGALVGVMALREALEEEG